MRNVFDVRNADLDSLKAPDLTPVTIVSADGHAALPCSEYKPYLEAKYRDFVDDLYFEDFEVSRRICTLMGYPWEQEALDIMDERRALRNAGEVGFFDPVWRLRQVEAEGVAAEFLHPFGAVGFAPFIDVSNSKRSHELRAAGTRAHNRFLQEFCSEAPGRLLGVPLVYPWPDWDAAVEQIKWARESGFYAIYPPSTAGVEDDLPPLYDPWWEPMWAACEDYGIVVHVHASFGLPQGNSTNLVKNLSAIDFDSGTEHQDSVVQEVFSRTFATFGERRPLWQLIWGGVFDRHPGLKVAFVEVHADWVPPTLDFLDRMNAAEPGPFKLTPTEYWHRHCAIGGSLMRYGDVAVRHEIGIDKLMFGTDYPHFEGTWPNTHDWIRATLDSIPEQEARSILGENAIKFYGLDRELIEKTAKRIGPLPAQIIGGGHSVPPGIIRHFEWRAGIDKPVEYDEERVHEVFLLDRAGALGAAGAVSA